MSALPPLTLVYQKHRRRAVAVVRRILRDTDEAEDVVQDVFVRMYAQGVRFDGASAYTTWLHRILVNSSINRLRALKRRGKLSSTLWGPEDPEEAAVGRQEHELLLSALSRLSQQHRLVVTLRDLRGFSYSEIAKTLDLPEGTVKSALNRARANLLVQLRETSPS